MGDPKAVGDLFLLAFVVGLGGAAGVGAVLGLWVWWWRGGP